jgi:DNA primase
LRAQRSRHSAASNAGFIALASGSEQATLTLMQFSDEFIAEIKERVRPSDVIGRRVKLVKKGREWSGLSPFSAEKTPSFFVNDSKKFWHDFSSGQSGDVITFLMETERLSFVDAVVKLAEHAGIPLPTVENAPKVQAEMARDKQLLALIEAAATWFESRLRAPEGAQARAYLEGRGLKEADWRQFRIGFAPQGYSGLKSHLAEIHGARVDDMVDALLLAVSEDPSRGPYDRFRNRIMFPISDTRGRVVAFGGRVINPDDKPKYLNSPEGRMFHKGGLLYRLPEARKMSADAKNAGIIVAEGYMDVVALERAGFAACAPMGTALTSPQLDLLWSSGGTPIMCFDGDAAGQRAASKSIDTALPKITPDRTLRFIFLPERLDPDEFIKARGKDAMRDMVSGAAPLSEVLFQRERDRDPLTTPEAKAGFRRRLREVCAQITDPELAKGYREDLFARADALLGAKPADTQGRRTPWQDRPPGARGGRRGFEQVPVLTDETRNREKSAINPQDARAQNVLQRILRYPPMLDPRVEDVAQLQIEDLELRAIRDAILDVHASGKDLDGASVDSHLTALGKLRPAQRIRSWEFFIANRPGVAVTQVSVTQEGEDNQDTGAPRRPFDPLAFEAEWRNLLDLCRMNSDGSVVASVVQASDDDETDDDAFRVAQAALKALNEERRRIFENRTGQDDA